jgi:hypothetical protein
MSQHEILTEYFEDALENKQPEKGQLDFEILEVLPSAPQNDDVIITFTEDDEEVFETEEPVFEEETVTDQPFAEELNTLEQIEEEVTELEEEIEDTLPGATQPIIEDEANDDVQEEEEVVEKDWEHDRDVTKFMDHLRTSFANIPPHSGSSISGCERALKHLNKLNKDISEAVRNDSDDALGNDLEEIESFRVKILRGMVALKKRIGELRKKIQDAGGTKKKADENLVDFMKEALVTSEGIVKEATTPKVQMFITPFERAITGILINSVVSAGNPFEDVYEYLKKKFDLTPREELAILQIVMDMGFPIFKDRGTIGNKEGDESEEGHGIDFIKNYFN